MEQSKKPLPDFNQRKSFLLTDTQISTQQMIINGVPSTNQVETHLALCSVCNTVIFSEQPGVQYSIFIQHLDTLAVNNRLGYCPVCGSKITAYPTITISYQETPQEEAAH